MTKEILKALCIFTMMSTSSMAFDYMSNCSSNGSIDLSYTMCVNSNFRTVQRKTKGLFLSNCSNVSNKVKPSYVNCVNSNFRKVERKIKDIIFLPRCFNSDDDLTFSFTSCVNDNFRRIDREID